MTGSRERLPQNGRSAFGIEAIRNGTDPITLPEQAFCVTRILEGIYTSAKTGEIYRF